MSARCSFVLALVLLFSYLATIVAVAQNSASENGNEVYERALHELFSEGRSTSLEMFLEDYPNSRLRKDALELLIWKYEENHFLDKAAWAARSLTRVDPENAAALAVMAESGGAMTRTGPLRTQDLRLTRNTATRGLLALPGFTAPYGVSPVLFDEIRREVKAALDSALGIAALNSKDYLTAQVHLREAVRSTPEDVDRLYSLALAYLLATPPDNRDGMWFLARVCNLAPPDLAGRAEARGRELSRSLYGSESRWEDLLRKTQFAAFPATPASVPAHDPSLPAPSSATNDARREGPSAVLKIKVALFDAKQVLRPVPRLEITLERLDANHRAYSRTVVTDDSGTAQLTLAAGRYGILTPRGITSGEQWYTWDLEVVTNEPRNYLELTNQNATSVHLALSSQAENTAPVSRTTPIFLGVVVDTSAAMGNRLSLVKNSLLASLPELRPGEQAFLVEAGGGPRITEGLTSDVTLLRKAISRMTPNGRNGLYDGVMTAANYLRGSAGQGTLALLVIANARDTASHSRLKDAVAVLRSLHINTYCIGTRYNDDQLHDILSQLASSPGDEALFPRLPNLTAISRSVVESLGEQPAPSPSNGTAADAGAPSAASPRPLRSYSAVTVKQFVVEESPDTSGFPGGDEVLLQKLVIGRMRKYTAFREVSDGGESRDPVQDTAQPGDRLTLAGIVVGYNPGGRVRRDLVGVFGGVMTLTVRFVFRDVHSGDEVFRTELTSTGGPVFFGGSVEEMRSQAMLRLADALIKVVNKRE